jgi:hypothetical protein
MHCVPGDVGDGLLRRAYAEYLRRDVPVAGSRKAGGNRRAGGRLFRSAAEQPFEDCRQGGTGSVNPSQ